MEYELRCLLNKPGVSTAATHTHTSYHWNDDWTCYNRISGSFLEKDWTEEDKSREQELMAELVTIIEQRNQIVNNMDQDRQR